MAKKMKYRAKFGQGFNESLYHLDKNRLFIGLCSEKVRSAQTATLYHEG